MPNKQHVQTTKFKLNYKMPNQVQSCQTVKAAYKLAKARQKKNRKYAEERYNANKLISLHHFPANPFSE